MQFQEWQQIYREILEDFGFSLRSDQESAEMLSFLLSGRVDSPLEGLKRKIRSKRVLVCGNAPSLSSELKGLIDEFPPARGDVPTSIESISKDQSRISIAADGASAVMMAEGILPDVIVTDLDGDIEAIARASMLGSIIAVHAHGDNIEKLKEWIPLLQNVLGTAQCEPPPGIFNFGGFTDGDRCVFLAKHFGADRIDLIGFDFDDDTVTPRKKKKLSWARQLIEIALEN